MTRVPEPHAASCPRIFGEDWDEDHVSTIGWAAVAGLKVNTPTIGQGDFFVIRGGYSEGASRYVTNIQTPSGFSALSDTFSQRGNAIPLEAAFELDEDDVDIEGLPVWSVLASFSHNWSPKWQTNIYGSYAGGDVEEEDGEWNAWDAHVNLIYKPVPNLYFGIEGFVAGIDFEEAAAESFGVNEQDEETEDEAYGMVFRINRTFGS